jgi:hypothetical protein
MKRISLTRGKFAIVDDENYEWLIAMGNWCCSTGGYAVLNINHKKPNGKCGNSKKWMHREIMNPPSRLNVDHINGDKLDNRKSNLRVCTHSENMKNRKTSKNSISELKGVIAHKPSGKWVAQIKSNKIRYYLGFFEDKYEAAKAYNAAALKYHGEFAKLNEIP